MNTDNLHQPTPPSLTGVRIYYCFYWLAAALIATLSETELLPTGYLTATPQSLYALEMASIVITISTVWLGLKIMAFNKVKRGISACPGQLVMWNVVRTSAFGLSILFNLWEYYALLSSTTPLFALLITLTAYVFCWPKNGE